MENEVLTIHDSILVITKDGVLKRVWCPFKVKVICSIGILKEEQVCLVLSVRMAEVRLMYVIGQQVYCHTYFIILTDK